MLCGVSVVHVNCEDIELVVCYQQGILPETCGIFVAKWIVVLLGSQETMYFRVRRRPFLCRNIEFLKKECGDGVYCFKLD